MSIKGQITKQHYLMFERMKAFGQSKRQLKVKALAEGQAFWYYYREKIFSIQTFKTYYSLVKLFVHWCADRYGIRNVYHITPKMFKAFIREQIGHKRASSLSTYLSAIAKFGEGRGMAEAFHRTAKQLRKELPQGEAPRRPRFQSEAQALAVCAYIEARNARYALAYQIQLDAGLRVCELGFGREALADLHVTDAGETVGVLRIIGKGGKERRLETSAELYRAVEQSLEGGHVLVQPERYRKAVYRAQKALGFRTCGTHKLRRTSAQRFFSDLYRELRRQGLTSKEASQRARQATAERLGHVRPGITEIYLKA